MKINTFVTVYWQDNIIYNENTNKFIIGNNVNSSINFIIPPEKLDVSEWVLLNNNILNIPEGATAHYNNNELLDKTINLNEYDKINVNISDLHILIQKYNGNLATPRYDLNNSLYSKVYIGLSAIFHIILMSAFSLFMPPLGISDDEIINKDQLLLIQQYLKASAERELDMKEDIVSDKNTSISNEGGTGSRAAGEEGSMGNLNSNKTNKSYTISGEINNQNIQIAKAKAIAEASDFGLIGILHTNSGNNIDSPIASWGQEYSLGQNDFSSNGNMWGNEPGESNGMGGLGLSGIGESGGGRGEGIGVGYIGTIGHGSGLGNKQEFGNDYGKLNRKHEIKVPKVRIGVTSVNGRLPAEIIQRIVRQNYGRFRSCYEQGLRNNPSLQGRVSVRFVIGRDGSVSNVANGGSDIPDGQVTQCVIRTYYSLSFPSPDNGIVTVVYPIMFSPE